MSHQQADGGRKHVLISYVCDRVFLITLYSVLAIITQSRVMSRYLKVNSEPLASDGYTEILEGILTSLVVYT